MTKQMQKPREAGPFWFDGGPLPLKLCFAPDAEAWDYALAKAGLDPEPYPEKAGNCSYWAGGVSKFPETVIIITINVVESIDVPQIVGIIAHEATHALQVLMQHMHPGYPIERHDEVEAYFIQWATQNIFACYLDWQTYQNGLTKAGRNKNKKKPVVNS